MDIFTIVISVIVGIVVGGGIAFLGANLINKKNNEKKAANIIEEAKAGAEVIKKDKILQAKETSLQLRAEHEKAISQRERKMTESENRIKQKETALNNKLQEVNKKDRDLHNLKANLGKQLEVAEAKQAELDKNHLKQVEMLEQVASMSKEDAKAQLVEVL